MKARAGYSFKGLKTEARTTVLIGGGEDFCRERFGYRLTAKGLEPGLCPVAVVPLTRIANMVFSEYLPDLGFSVFVTKAGQVARWNSTEYAKLTTATMLNPNPPFVVACADGDEPTYALIGGTKIAIFKGTTVSTHTLPYRVTGGVYHCGRIFAVDREDSYVIRWSGFALRDWVLAIEQGGHMRISPDGGMAMCIVEMGEKLVVVRERAITVLNALADARHFRFVQYASIFLPTVRDKSAVVVGGKLYLCTEEGLHVYDGTTLSRVEVDTCGKNYSFGRTAAFKNRYIYITCTDGEGQCFLEYDTQTGATVNFAKGADMLFTTDDALYCLAGDRSTTVSLLTADLEDENRVWVSRDIDLGTTGTKTLKYVTWEGEGNSEIIIRCDGRTRTVNRTGRIYVGEVGVSFTFSVRGTGTVTRLAAEWEVRK
ncbi:MAG: hypothetical protein K2N17_01610 [Clostridia bacterium]|nr:hypothetical protein [Clostridia bacterium]